MSWVAQMREGHRILHGSDAPCTELGWVCCNPHSENKTDQQQEQHKNTQLTSQEQEEVTAVYRHSNKNNSQGSCSFETYLLETIVLVTVGTVPAVPVPIGHHCVLITEPAVHICMGWLLSVNKRSSYS